MKKNVFLTVFLLSIFCLASAQEIEQKMKDQGVAKGVIYKDGKEIEGYIKQKGKVYGFTSAQYLPAPWDFQGDIKFIPKDEFENTAKIKGNMYKKYGPKDISGYTYEDTYFEAVKYADMTAVGLNMIPKWMFMKKVINGPISAYYYYDTPTIIVSNDAEATYKECAQEIVVYKKGKDGKLKAITGGIKGVNIDKDLDDCPFVKAKLDNKEYDTNALDGSGLENSKAGKLLSKLSKLSGDGAAASRIAAIEDYNANCGK